MSRTQRLIGALAIILVIVGARAYLRTHTTKPAAAPSPSAAVSASPSVSTVSYRCVAGKTALDVLKSSHTVNEKTSDYGTYVQGIDGKDGDDKHYWSFYVDGTAASVGASSYTCKNSESIEWRYTNL